jgi:hypothetical protein
MRRVALMIGVVAMVMAFGVGSAAAFTGGGRSPSEAPLVVWGQHYEAELGNKESEANYLSTSCCTYSSQVGIWHLGPLNVHDQVVVNWHELPFAHDSDFPVTMLLVENAEDFNWGSSFNDEVNDEKYFRVSGSGTARTEITVQNSSPNDYLMFFSTADETNSAEFETFKYDFSVEAPRHYLGLSLGAVPKVAANGYLHATATLASGGPVPDGYPVTLTGTWSGGGVFSTTATTIAGQVTFPLAMPETSLGKGVEFVASGAATAEYQAATSAKVFAEITKPPAPPAPTTPPKKTKKTPKATNLCTMATNHAHALARQYKRLYGHAYKARGRARHRLLHRAHAMEHRFLAARAEKKAAC